MKKVILILSCLFSVAFASTLENYYKIYSKDADVLYMNALSALNSSSKFEVVEMQSRNGYILFLAGNKYYLLTLTKRYQNQTEIKIMPQNSDFSTSDEVVGHVFSLIDSSLRKLPMEPIK